MSFSHHIHLIQDLQNAVENNNIDGVIDCLEQGVDPNAPFRRDIDDFDNMIYESDTCFTVACIHAAHNGNFDIIQAFIYHGANINPDNTLNTPLSAICKTITKMSFAIVKILLTNGADPNARNGLSLVNLVNNNTNNDIVEDIFKLMISYEVDVDLGFPLIHACSSSQPNLHIIQLLVECGANVNLDDGLHSPLSATIAAATSNNVHVSIVKYLLKHGANPDLFINGFTPLQYGCDNANIPIVHILLTFGATNLGNFPGNAITNNRISSPDPKIINLLLEHNIPIHYKYIK